MMPENLIIEASAGTGKTYRLAQRLIALLESGVEPSSIVALTFSRAAAGEIFARFVAMLAAEAKTKPAYADYLRRVIATQHLSMIGTLDSFLLRIVRLFPLELGLDGSADIMPAFTASSEAAKVSFSILRRTDQEAKKLFLEAFARALGGDNVRSFVASYREFVGAWHDKCLEYDSNSAWGEPGAIWRGAPPVPLADEKDLSDAADVMLKVCTNDKNWIALAETVRSFRGSFGTPKGYLAKLLGLDRIPVEGSIEFNFNKKTRSFTGVEAQILRNALYAMFGYALRQKFALAKGIRSLIVQYEKEYDSRVRRKGKLVFSDVPRLIANLDDNSRLALEYRMDSRIAAWALDEFQDTSREQWRVISNIVDESAQANGEKSVFIVGDRKQAIYGWRNGDIAIFEREIASGKYHCIPLNESRRLGPALVEAVNKIFVHGPLPHDFPNWRCDEHFAYYKDRAGLVQCVEAASTSMEAFVDPVFNALSAVDPVSRGISTAILVRNNDIGEFLADELKKRGMRSVVWEGESSVLDTPVLNAFLDLVIIADHPGDVKAYRHFISTPLAKAKFPDGVPAPEVLSALLASEFSAKGLVRVFRAFRDCLPAESEAAWNVSIEERFEEMLHAAGEFEILRDNSAGLSNFVAFLTGRKRRSAAEKGKIKIITIHRSKGLGFDYVLLPLYESRAIDSPRLGAISGDGWILPGLSHDIAKNIPGIDYAAAERDSRECLESLCVYYVAMTRALRSMTVIIPPAPKNSTVRRFSDYVRMSLPQEIGVRDWYLSYTKSDDASHSPAASDGVKTLKIKRPPREFVRRRLPSQLLQTGMSAGEFFAPNPKRLLAIKKGVEAHAKLAEIEWWPDAPTDDLREAFTKPDDFVELWREKPYEMFENGIWESGVIDRVVFAGGNAKIYDFKRVSPNSHHDYSKQLESYRRAVNRLTGIDLSRISAKIIILPRV